MPLIAEPFTCSDVFDPGVVSESVRLCASGGAGDGTPRLNLSNGDGARLRGGTFKRAAGEGPGGGGGAVGREGGAGGVAR